MSEENINNKYLDIVDNSVLGNGSIVNDTIRSVLQAKIADEIENHRQNVASAMFNVPAEADEVNSDETEDLENNTSEEDNEPDSEEETEEETIEA